MRLRGERGKISPSPTPANKDHHSDRGPVCIVSKLLASETCKRNCFAGATEAGFDCAPRERKRQQWDGRALSFGRGWWEGQQGAGSGFVRFFRVVTSRDERPPLPACIPLCANYPFLGAAQDGAK